MVVGSCIELVDGVRSLGKLDGICVLQCAVVCFSLMRFLITLLYIYLKKITCVVCKIRVSQLTYFHEIQSENKCELVNLFASMSLLLTGYKHWKLVYPRGTILNFFGASCDNCNRDQTCALALLGVRVLACAHAMHQLAPLAIVVMLGCVEYDCGA